VAAGELEGSILHAFIRGTNLRRWLERPECPPALRECKVLFDRVFRRGFADGTGVTNQAEELFEQKLPDDLQALLKGVRVGKLQARYRVNDVMYCRQSTHVGNSLILFYPGGKRESSYVPGTIKYIIQTAMNSTVLFACQRHLNSQVEFDPFAIYPYFPAKLYTSALSDTLELVELDWVYSHFARYEISSGDAVILCKGNLAYL
jgi:hypothetical protein